MSKQKVTVIDYGLGNLYSVRRALEYCGAENVVVSSLASDINQADKLVLPGVGAFEDGMNGLRKYGLIDAIINYASSERPLMGICLGMQLLATVSEEFGQHEGLDLIPGRVVEIPRQRSDGRTCKVPFIGWSKLDRSDDVDWKQTFISIMSPNDAVYLVHSYHVKVDKKENLLATYNFDGYEVTAAISKRNIVGLQFHPEKSGSVGLRIIKNFLNNINS